MQQQSLVEIFNEIGNFSGNDLGGNDKNSTHHYLPTYDKIFEPFRNGCDFMEIGLATGDSIKLWDRYFENSNIIGVDISLVFAKEGVVISTGNNNSIQLIECDATSTELLNKLPEGIMYDIINEDASHVTDQQIQTFHLLKHKMKKGSIYLIEDILNIEWERERYLALHENVEIIDLRHISNRFDDVIIKIQF